MEGDPVNGRERQTSHATVLYKILISLFPISTRFVGLK